MIQYSCDTKGFDSGQGAQSEISEWSWFENLHSSSRNVLSYKHCEWSWQYTRRPIALWIIV